MKPTRQQLEKAWHARLNIIIWSLIATLERMPTEDEANEVLNAVWDAEGIVGSEIGPELQWADVRRMIAATLKICLKKLEERK